jgi:hypothetical protein
VGARRHRVQLRHRRRHENTARTLRRALPVARVPFSCSARRTPRAARVARSWRITSTAPSHTSSTMTCRSSPRPAARSRGSTHTSAGWAGASLGVLAAKRVQRRLRRLHRRGATNRHRLQLRLAAESRPQRPPRRAAGLSAFALDGEVVYHTYSCYDRGTDVLHGTWQLLDRAPKGRGENPEDWPRRHDEY